MAKTYTEHYRYERKFSVTDLSFEEVIRVVELNPATFRELYPPRYINNVYFESPFYKSYYETADGISNRQKFRLRWYGELRPQAPVNSQLEIKIRKGLLNTKKTFPIDDADLSALDTQAIKANLLESNSLPSSFRENLVSKIPLLINRYRRNYYISSDKKFRLTVDRNIQYLSGKNPDLFIDNQLLQRGQVVVEIKYTIEDDMKASKISSRFPFRLTRNSKYSNGVETLMSHYLI